MNFLNELLRYIVYVYIQEMSLGPFTTSPLSLLPFVLVFGWLGGFSFYLICVKGIIPQ